MRCKCCNNILSDSEIFSKKIDRTPEDLCMYCRGKARQTYMYTEEYLDRWGVHMELGDILTEIVSKDKFDYYEGSRNE